MKLKNTYTSIACNRTTESADWGNNGWIVFGACNAVCIFDPKHSGNSAKIIHTYARHTKRVNTVQWIRSTPNAHETHFLSGADDSLAILWDIEDPLTPKCYPLKGHESGVNAVAGIFKLNRQQGQILLATASADSTLKLWTYDDSRCDCIQTILLNNGFCFSVRLAQLPLSAHVLLAFSSDDESVSLWSQTQPNSQEFQRAHKLTGHEDWVRGLDFIEEGDDLLLASCAQDNFIRLWRISPRTETEVHANTVNIFNLLEETTDEIRVEEKILQLAEGSWYAVSLESVLYGHDAWVYGVHWHSCDDGLQLLSASIDKTLIIWEATEDGVWMEKVRVGEVGGNSLGFFGGKFSSDGKSIFGHSYQGGFHIWNQSEENENIWTPNVIVSGHFDEVRDLAWEPQGQYLMTVSADQTTRIHAPWIRNNKSQDCTWHELARPQVHGYDMQALAILSRYKFASGAEEKIVRTFQASSNFVENFKNISSPIGDEEGDALLSDLPKGASVPSLGLSNKAVYNLTTPAAEEKHVKDQYPENYFVPITLNNPPQEEALMQNTLWPEVQKLYGHGYEIYSLAASADGQLLASSCRATNAEHAQIILWNTLTWKQVQKLSTHQLTVTQLRFSPNGKHLLSVSRDRRWALFSRNAPEESGEALATFALAATTDKTNGIHTRIIWSCDWSHDSTKFVTSSREGKVVIWNHSSDIASQSSLNGWQSVGVLELKNESITAVAFASHTLTDGSYVLALGADSGLVRVFKFNGKWDELLTISNDNSHHLTVKRLQFRPTTSPDSNHFQLASCGDDHFVRIYDLSL